MRITLKLNATLAAILLPLGCANAAATPTLRFANVATGGSNNISVDSIGLPAVRQIQRASATWAIISLTIFFQRVEAK